VDEDLAVVVAVVLLVVVVANGAAFTTLVVAVVVSQFEHEVVVASLLEVSDTVVELPAEKAEAVATMEASSAIATIESSFLLSHKKLSANSVLWKTTIAIRRYFF